MQAKTVAAIDVGASGGRAFLGIFSGGSFRMKEVHRFPNSPVCLYTPDRTAGKTAGRIYWDSLSIYAGILESLKKISEEGLEAVDSLGIDTWGADGVLFSPRGEMLGEMYNYRDHRLDGIRDELFRVISEKELFMKTGIPSHQFNQINQLFWLARNRPEQIKAAGYFMPVSSLFYHLLSGEKFCEYTWGTATQLLDPYRKNWAGEIFEKLDIPVSLMPGIVFPGTPLGDTHGEILDGTGLKRCGLTATATHDTASAYYAACAEEEETSFIISSGTWSLAGKLIPEPIINEFSFRNHFTNEGGVGNIRFLRNVMGTWILQELRRLWGLRDGREISWDELVETAGKGKSFSVFIDPDHDSFFNPPDMEKAIEDFCAGTGQEPPDGRAGMLRAVFESLALKYELVNATIEKATGKKNKKVYIVGGGARNSMLNQFIAEATGLPVRAGPVEATGAGNIFVQAVSRGIVNTREEAGDMIRKTFPAGEFRPENHDAWKKAADKFMKVVNPI